MMQADELYKFSNGTLKTVRDELHQRLLDFGSDFMNACQGGNGWCGKRRNRVNTYAIRNTKLLSGIEDSHHGPGDAMHNPSQPLKNDEVACHADDRMEIDAENAKDDYTNSQHHLDLLIKACAFKIEITTIDVLVPPIDDDRLLRTMKPNVACDQVDHFEDDYMLMLNDEEKPVKSSLDDMELEQQLDNVKVDEKPCVGADLAPLKVKKKYQRTSRLNYVLRPPEADWAMLLRRYVIPRLYLYLTLLLLSVNTELPKDVEEPKVQSADVTADSVESPKAGVFVVHPGSVAAHIKERKCKTRGGSLRPPMKRKLASGSSSSYVIRAKTSASKDDAPILSIFDDDEGKFLVHLVLSECIDLLIHPLSSLYIMVDNAVNKRAHEFLQVIEKMSGEADVIKARERSREEECEELPVKCEAAMKEFDQNPAVPALREKISSPTADVGSLEAEKARLEAVEASLHREVEEHKQDRRDVVSKVVPYATIELVHSDELGRLVGKLVSSAITYGRCRAYEQVTAMKEPFDLSKAKGYRSSYQKEHTHASNNFATATFPWLNAFIADAAAPIEALLSNKPPTLQKLSPSKT
ncbi:hypothetical protein Tco_0378684 [Tanacetum coccineum]